jgi:phage regulator Rha-like protein
MNKSQALESIAGRILLLRGNRVMLDSDLAELYCVSTKQLNQQVKRNIKRFPADFMLRLKASEWEAMWSQIVTTSQSRRRSDARPYAFTEHGCLMLANILRTARAAEVSVLIVRAFVRLGHELSQHSHKLATHEHSIMKLLAEVRRLTRLPEAPVRPIGFTANLASQPNKRET